MARQVKMTSLTYYPEFEQISLGRVLDQYNISTFKRFTLDLAVYFDVFFFITTGTLLLLLFLQSYSETKFERNIVFGWTHHGSLQLWLTVLVFTAMSPLHCLIIMFKFLC